MMGTMRITAALVVGVVAVFGFSVEAVAGDDTDIPSRLTLRGQPLDRLVRTEPAAPFVAFDPGLLSLDTQGDVISRSVSGGEQGERERGKEGQTPYTPALEIAGGYQGVQTGRHGWFASAARPLGDRFAIVVEFADASYRSAGGVSRKTGPWFAEDSHRYTYLGGVRYAFSDARVTPFVQALSSDMRN